MNVIIHPVHFDASSQLVEFINKKIKKLETFFDKIIDAEVFLKLDSNQSIKDKIVELKIHLPGKTIFVSEIAKTFEECFDIVMDTVSRQIKKHKEKGMTRPGQEGETLLITSTLEDEEDDGFSLN